MGQIVEQISNNQTIEKSALIIAGTTLISLGGSIVAISGKELVGLGILALGSLLLIMRELIKLKIPNE